MSKSALKMMDDENGRLWDIHRNTPRAEGGTYTEGNSIVLTPRQHMAIHGNLRERSAELEILKSAVDSRRQIMKLYNKINNQVLAFKRGVDERDAETVKRLEASGAEIAAELKLQDKRVVKAIKVYAESDALSRAALEVKGVGPITVAHCAVYIDVTKARHASSLWKYAGLHCPNHERYIKGEAGGGNKTLRTALYTLADSQIKSRGPYRKVYDQVKDRLSKSDKETKTRNTQGNWVIKPWKDVKPCHRDGAAKRAIMKHFLADYWFVGRTLLGLEAGPCYAEAQLKGEHRTVQPTERGWKW